MDNQAFESLLAKWLNETITREERIQLEKHKDFASYAKIAKYTAEFYVPGNSEDVLYDKFLAKASKEKKNTVRSIRPLVWLSGLAASIVALIGLFQLFSGGNVHFETSYGEQLDLWLPDSSKVVLNSKSTLTFKGNSWDKTRRVKLVGEGFFKVKKGSSFAVETPQGTVRVLGTAFTVNAYDEMLEVVCFEGVVQVERNGEIHLLKKGAALRQIGNDAFENWQIQQQSPSWRHGEKTFNNIPLKFVLQSLEYSFNKKMKASNLDLEKRFTGSYHTTDLTLALTTIADAMNLKFKITKGEVLFY
jgi:ferric-dicitrate binding protein FerR (iron transport regulator)